MAGRVFAVLAILLLGRGALSEERASVETDEARSHPGTIKGIVKYEADPARQWRFARYYVKNPNAGWLAEAVVALEGVPVPPKGEPVVHTMDQVNFQFAPETMAIRAGDRVRFLNSDDSLHNVMTSDGEKPFNENVMKGDELLQTFPRPGGIAKPIRLGCVFHGGMRAWIYVFDHPWYGITRDDGQFDFKNVPPGEYTLSVVHPAGRLRSTQKIKILPGETRTIEVRLSPDDLIGAKDQK